MTNPLRRRVRLCLLLILGSGGCGAEPTRAALDWSSCGGHECATLMLTRDSERATPQVRHVALRRLRATGQATQQIWLLAGGPGYAGTRTFQAQINLLNALLPDADVYTLDSFGTGGSDFLSCDSAETAAACGASVAEPSSYGFTAAAFDLEAAIAANTHPQQRLVLYGLSAGTVWLQRFLSIYAGPVDAIVLDSFVPPNFSARTIDDTAELALNALLDRCGANASCSSRLPTAKTRLRALWRKLEGGSCPQVGLSVGELQQRFFRMLSAAPFNALLPVLIFRLDRCERQDAAVSRALLDLVSSAPASAGTAVESTGYSPAVYNLITASELWNGSHWTSELDYREHLAKRTPDWLLGAGAGGASASEELSRIPQYDDPLVGQWPESEAPMLILNGGLDPRIDASSAQSAARHYRGSSQHYVKFPNAAHNLSGGTPTSNGDCATRMIIAFLRAPSASLDTTCTQAVYDPDFTGSLFARSMFGERDLWSDGLDPSARP